MGRSADWRACGRSPMRSAMGSVSGQRMRWRSVARSGRGRDGRRRQFCYASPVTARRSRLLPIAALALLAAAPARAERIVVADVDGEGDEAGAVTLLLRSALASEARKVVPIGDLRSALTRFAPGKRSAFLVDAASAPAVMKGLAADLQIG